MIPKIPLLFPIGHFYSPICDPIELHEQESALWPGTLSSEMPGIALNAGAQVRLLDSLAPFVPQISFPYESTLESPPRYFYNNDQYPCLDAEVLFCMLRHLEPQRVVEIGSGYSSLITAEVNRKFRSGAMEFTCIEPYPRQFLIDGVPGVTTLIRKKAQQIGLSLFRELGPGDIIFIDSSHVTKAGSDVNYLFFEILPSLRPGAWVHIHDIFLPDEYPKRWVLDEGRNWNEQYLVRAFLQYNEVFEIAWSSYYMCTRHAAETVAIFPRFREYGAGGSLWLRRRS